MVSGGGVIFLKTREKNNYVFITMCNCILLLQLLLFLLCINNALLYVKNIKCQNR